MVNIETIEAKFEMTNYPNETNRIDGITCEIKKNGKLTSVLSLSEQERNKLFGSIRSILASIENNEIE